jgi:DNA-binding NarL/FixJ family response regulator
MREKLRIIIAEDHAIVREALKALLASVEEFEAAGEAEDGRAAIELNERVKADILLADLSMPKMGGFDMIAAIKKRSPETKVIALTAHKGEEYIQGALKAGADGYLLKECSSTELVTTINTILKGKNILPPRSPVK